MTDKIKYDVIFSRTITQRMVVPVWAKHGSQLGEIRERAEVALDQDKEEAVPFFKWEDFITGYPILETVRPSRREGHEEEAT